MRKKCMFSKSTEYQGVEGSNQTAESYIFITLWRIKQSREEFYT